MLYADREAHARDVCTRLLHSPPAGCYASAIRVLKEENNVGGCNVGMPLPIAVQRRVFCVTQKNFTGTISQLSLGVDPTYQVRATALFFNTGSAEVIGARSADCMRMFNHRLVERLHEAGYTNARLQFLSLDNKVASGHIGYPVALERVHNNLPSFQTHYMPAKFPGCICAYHDNARGIFITMLVFEEGKVMALGIEDIEAANCVFISLVTMCAQFRIPPGAIRQRHKSSERVARLENEQAQGGGRGAFARAKAIGKRVTQFLDSNRGRLGDTEFQTTLKRRIDELVSAMPAPKRVVARTADDGLDGELDEDELLESGVLPSAQGPWHDTAVSRLVPGFRGHEGALTCE